VQAQRTSALAAMNVARAGARLWLIWKERSLFQEPESWKNCGATSVKTAAPGQQLAETKREAESFPIFNLSETEEAQLQKEQGRGHCVSVAKWRMPCD